MHASSGILRAIVPMPRSLSGLTVAGLSTTPSPAGHRHGGSPSVFSQFVPREGEAGAPPVGEKISSVPETKVL